MGHYDLYRMGWQQFEHMTQAFAKEMLGNGVRPFGSGRDGQREADFNGKVNFPVGSSGAWNGYGVVQAKHKEQRSNASAEASWFLREVQKELKGWQLKKLQSKKTPQYLLFATNIALSGVEEVGGKDRFDALLSSFAADPGLKGWYVWDYSEFRTMLDAHGDIRRRYLEQIIVGDVLESLAELLPERTAIEAGRLASHAVAELISRQWVRTGDVGYGDGSKVRLADIAIDLPCVVAGSRASASERYQTVHATIGRGNATYTSEAGRGPTGVVLVGGPGQGKSTLAQLIAHSYRLSFLKDTDVSKFGPKALEAVGALSARLVRAGIDMPQKRRWPFVVELSKLGAAIAGTEATFSLLGYIAAQIFIEGRRTAPSVLFDWMKSWPVCLVLDGLDEVPDARIRSELVSAISAFATEASAHGVDLFIVATSRPQGYRGEFGEAAQTVEFRLVELTEREALSYSEALTRLRAANDPDLAAQVTERLITAVHERVTQRLMTTPLQVTIMTALAEEAVELPTDRFELFDRYYKVVYDREVAKSEAFSELKALRAHIDYLHEAAGAKLQQLAERPSGSDPVLAKSEISRILRKRLGVAGFGEAESDSMAEQLIRLSTERLVLLVSRRVGKYEFDVRSLQEYMAARELTNGEDATVLERLAQILPASHWRNTWLLAAGRILKRREHLREAVVQLATDYDATDAETSITKLGAELSTELYLDNFGTEYPGTRRALLASAMSQFMDTSPDVPPPLWALLETALAQNDDRELEVLLGGLHDIAQSDLSSLAAKVLSENSAGMTPLAKQARITLNEGRKYVRTHALSPGAAVTGLESDIGRLLPDTRTARELRESLLIGGPVRGVDDAVLLTTLRVLQIAEARDILVEVVRKTRTTRPGIARYAASILKLRASRPNSED
ncbi:hypothetical protein ABC304_13425 [Microbacterium sp. 1P10UB]|uniref:NACHT domain-containing protein n=1 Tax=unclassified Microbacterium TaxID=2609290 RepID=UPI00399EFBBF